MTLHSPGASPVQEFGDVEPPRSCEALTETQLCTSANASRSQPKLDQELLSAIADGGGQACQWCGLVSDQELQDGLTYVRSLGGIHVARIVSAFISG